MKIFIKIIIVGVVLTLGLSLGLWSHAPWMDSPRLNAERLALKGVAWLSPGQSVEIKFTAAHDNLARVDWFMRADFKPWVGDEYEVVLEDRKTGAAKGPFRLKSATLADDVAEIRFDPIPQSKNKKYTVRITSDEKNRGLAQLANDGDVQDRWGVQPYYFEEDHGAVNTVKTALIRLGWRTSGLGLLVLGLGGILFVRFNRFS